MPGIFGMAENTEGASLRASSDNDSPPQLFSNTRANDSSYLNPGNSLCVTPVKSHAVSDFSNGVRINLSPFPVVSPLPEALRAAGHGASHSRSCPMSDVLTLRGEVKHGVAESDLQEEELQL